MPPVSIETTKLELRRDARGRFRLFFDGVFVPGAMSITTHQDTDKRPIVTVMFVAQAVRIVEAGEA